MNNYQTYCLIVIAILGLIYTIKTNSLLKMVIGCLGAIGTFFVIALISKYILDVTPSEYFVGWFCCTGFFSFKDAVK